MPQNIKTDDAFLKMLTDSAQRELSRSELLAQRVSFILGNLPQESTMTRERIEKILGRLEGNAA